MHNDEFSNEQDREDALAGPRSNTAQEVGLRTAKVTDHRDFDVWTNDQGFLQRFLMDKPPTWRTAIQRYWRERCTRRALAAGLGLNLESTKNLLRRIRKAARDERNGQRKKVSWSDGDCQAPRQCHSKITAADIYAICDGDEDALAHLEEYGRLNIIERLNMFSPAITGELMKVLDHSEAIGGSNEAITSGLLAKADALKAKVVKPHPLIDRPLFSIFPDQRTSMQIPEVDENGDVRWKVRIIGRSEAEPVKRGRPRQPRKEKKPATITPKRRSRKIPISDLRVVPIPPRISHGRSFYVA